MNTGYGQVRYTQKALKEQVSAGQQPAPSQYMHAIHNELLQNRNYAAGEDVFQDFVAILQSKQCYQNMDIACFQKSIARLIRSAPNDRKALYYVNMLLSDFMPPLRDEKIENTVLIDLIKQYGRWRGEFYMKGLDLVRIGVERGLATRNNRSHYFQQEDVFQSACAPFLRHHGLRFSDDGRALEKR